MGLAEVRVLLEGYVQERGEQEEVQPTVSLVIDGDIIMIVDPGVLENQNVLVEKIIQQGFEVDDINYVCLTHSHIDHYKNIGMFPEAKVLEYFGIWDKNLVQDRPSELTENIKILLTSGHDYTSITLLVKTEQGNVAICGDVFWSKNKPDIDPYAQDLKKLDESRKLVLSSADFIIPGHGAMYEVEHNLNSTKNKVKSIFSVTNPINIFSTIKQKFTAQELGVCRKCRKSFKSLEEKCVCQNWLCFECCECKDDCDQCNCFHKQKY